MKSFLHPFDWQAAATEIDEVRFRRDLITVVVHVAVQVCKCPLCGVNASRVHSFYWRRVADLPWLGTRVRILWRSRRFFCDNPRCVRKIFTERCPNIAGSYARSTLRHRRTLRSLALVCGGEAGSRLARRIGLTASGDTLLRVIRECPPPSSVTPRVLGVDDWAIRRGQQYGTILCDLERHCVVDVLPDRSAESFAAWLKNHPGVEVISRDRGDIYIRGAREGAPAAVQVTDRWHLLKNLYDALVRILDRHGSDIQVAACAVKDLERAGKANRHDQKCDSAAKTLPQNVRLQLVEQHRQLRLKRYEEILSMRKQGFSMRAIARRMGMHRSTVRRYASATSFPERQQRRYPRGTDSYEDFLRRRWEEGCRSAKQLTRELQDQGFKGSYYMVRRRVRAWRKSSHDDLDADTRQHARTCRMTSRRTAWTLMKSPEERNKSEQAFVTTLCQSCPPVAAVHRLAIDFNSMMKHRDAADLDQWLDKASTSELARFGKGLAEDKAAVRAALELPWSNGQTEGQVNRLKTLKRQMYGRASIDLLKMRMLAE